MRNVDGRLLLTGVCAAILSVLLSAPHALAQVTGGPRRIAVLRTVVDGVDPGVGAQVSARVAQAVKVRTGAEVLSSEDIAALLVHEQQKQVAGCEQESCLSEIADALGADVVVQARLSRVDGGYALSLTALDSMKAQIVSRVDERWGGEPLLLLDATAPAVDRLFPSLGPKPEGTLSLDGVKDGSRILIDDVVRGTAPAGQIAVAAGAHRVSVTLEGHEPTSAWVIVGTGAAVTLPVQQVALAPPPLSTTWWFWTAVGGVTAVAVAGGASALWLLGNDGGGAAKTGVLVQVNGDDVLGGAR